MKKDGYKTLFSLFLILLNLVCAAVLTAGIMKMGQSGYHVETWGDILKGRSWTGTSEYEQQAAELTEAENENRSYHEK